MKPILFNTDMVKAILDGRQTVTRRLVKSKNKLNRIEHYNVGYQGRYFMGNLIDGMPKEFTEMVHPHYKFGDILYVRETWGNWSHDDPDSNATYYQYKADYPDRAKTYVYDAKHVCDLPKWHPSIHMPKEAARIFLKIIGVRVEKLQDINKQRNHDDILKEGYPFNCIAGSPLHDFIFLWNSTIKKSELDKYDWHANPWVWVIEFERISKEEAYAKGN